MLATVSLLALGASFTTPARYAVRHGARAATPACEAPKPPADLEAVTEKYGLEAGLFTALKERGSSGEGGGGAAEQGGAMASAGDLLKRYGGAYLLTSTSLALVSFSRIYLVVSNGVDIGSLLQRVGIEVCARPPPLA